MSEEEKTGAKIIPFPKSPDSKRKSNRPAVDSADSILIGGHDFGLSEMMENNFGGSAEDPKTAKPVSPKPPKQAH